MTSRLVLTAALVLAACGVSPPTAPDAIPVDPPPAGGGGMGGGGGGSTPGSLAGQFGGLPGHGASGGVTVQVSGGVATITFGADFSSSPVPDPHVYLNTTADANRGQPIRIAGLTSARGAQVYSAQVPAGVTYTYVLVWCDRYNVGVGAAMLR